ncbi:MAG: hypothetical protein KGJ02_01170 [Verrucomicrobiota bacterium]|nr:hypothetical protein [Verrucomicrobiota bacterium]
MSTMSSGMPDATRNSSTEALRAQQQVDQPVTERTVSKTTVNPTARGVKVRTESGAGSSRRADEPKVGTLWCGCRCRNVVQITLAVFAVAAIVAAALAFFGAISVGTLYIPLLLGGAMGGGVLLQMLAQAIDKALEPSDRPQIGSASRLAE